MPIKLNIYSTDKYPDDEVLKNCLTSCPNKEFIHNMLLRFGLSSSFPQSALTKLGFSHASVIGEIDGEKIHIVLHSRLDNPELAGMWTYPDTDEAIERFTKIFGLLRDFNEKRDR